MTAKAFRPIYRTESAYSYPLLIKQLLHTPILYAPNQEIVYQDKARHTYTAFYDRIHRLAAGLHVLGVRPGDTVAVLDWDSHRYLEFFFAVPMMAAILHTVNIRLSPDQILYTMNHAEDTVVFVHEDFLPVLESIASRLKTVRMFILVKDRPETPQTTLPIAAEYEDMLRNAEASYDFPDFDEDVQATTFYTTGTTGEPKGVYFSHRQLVLHTLSVSVAVAGLTAPGRFQSGDVYMPITPMFHVHAWGFPYVATLLAAKQVYPGRYVPETILDLIQREKVTFSHCVPTILHMLVNHPKAETVELRGWKVNTGGMALPRGLARTLMEMGIEVFHGYGMSETCPILTLANLKPRMMNWEIDDQLDYRTKTGFPLPLVDLKILDEKGNPVPRDGVSTGEITVRTPWCTQGYFKNPEKSEELWSGGRLHTGDVAHMDDEGYVQITDRLKDAIKTGGEWISSLELESLLSTHEAVSECAVVGVPHEKWGERPMALIVLKSHYEGSVTGNDLRDFMLRLVGEGLVSKWAVPDTFQLVQEIPKTSVGKINKKLIREQWAPDRP
ncbi:MAG TPA: long-chain-fatty-acid--CoA ligase [Desulfomonilaceae bacterium]|nr:long-chain-fatty-acid--CoA ligase [Desulfomonilaceae bacterium]